MSNAKITVTLGRNLLRRLDRAEGRRRSCSRSRVVQEALREKLKRLGRGRLARECAKLDPAFEQELAEGGLVHGDRM